MRVTAPEGLAIVAAETDADLEAMIAVRTAADPDRTPPRLENLRHHLASDDALTYLIARLDGEPAGCGFVRPWPSGKCRCTPRRRSGCAAARHRLGVAGRPFRSRSGGRKRDPAGRGAGG